MSRFNNILKNAKGRTAEPREAPADKPATTPAPKPTPDANPPPAPPEPPPARRPGRPPGKRSDPNFDQVTAYIPHEVNRRVRSALIEDDKGQEFSELVADLLAEWLRSRG